MWSHGVQISVDGRSPRVEDGALIAPNVYLIGDVTVERGASIWFGAVLRADDAPIRIGAGSNVQDNAVIHVGPGRGTVLEEDVSVGHAAVVHNCIIRRGAVISIGAAVLDDAIVGVGALVAAGAVVKERFEVPDGHIAAGVPAHDMGPLGDRAQFFVDVGARSYHDLAERIRGTAIIRTGKRLGDDGGEPWR